MRISGFKKIMATTGLISLFMGTACGAEQAGKEIAQSGNPWFTDAQEQIRQHKLVRPITHKAKNIILFIGDGMGVSTVTAARILQGQMQGKTGEENMLSWEVFPHTALAKTYNTNQQVSDSAGTATAFMSGVKSQAGVLGVNENIRRGDCNSSKGNHVQSFLEIAEERGFATGIISTATLTHATPAAAYAHVPERGWQDDSGMSAANKSEGCIDIARQFVEFSIGDGIEVAFGGGRRSFLPKETPDPEGGTGQRTDGRDLTTEWQKKHANGSYVWNKAGFDEITTTPVLGLFNASHMQYERDRAADSGGEPSLAEMTAKGIELLSKKDQGYFLYVEGARIDHAHHGGNAARALGDTVAFSDAVKRAMEMTDSENTLIIVTADHSHPFTIGGYTTRGNPILGKVVENDRQGVPKDHAELALDGKPYTSVGYYMGPGGVDGAREDISEQDTEVSNYRQQAIVPLKSGVHGGEDVAIYARGPSAYLFGGVVEQNYIFHVMLDAIRP